MEKIKVNMSPNPLDVQTIHASQNDGEARQWEFELHNNGELIDTSDVKGQLVFKAYKGGTEQLLPENGSTPTTSPFLGDIRYPQGLLEDQEFTYRQSPTEEDGLAKITDVKGNTLVWNQLVQNGNFAYGTNNWEAGGSSTISASNGELTVTIGGAWNNDARQNRSLVAGHKYLGTFKVKSDTLTNIGVSLGQFGAVTNVRFASTDTLSSAYQTVVGIATTTESTSVIRCSLTANASSYTGQTFTIKDVMIFDLTKMGLDITDPSDFTSLFPLSYYSYNQGSLLSFNGNGIKTVGKNLWKYTDNVYTRQCTLNNQDGTITVSATGSDCYFGDVAATGSNYSAEKGWLIDVSGINNLAIRMGNNLFWKNYITRYDANKVSLGFQAFASDVFTADVSNCTYVSFRFGYANSVSGTDYVIKPQVEIGTQSTDFEPYTSSTLSLPISQYFPDGMKSAGNVYDELTEAKYVKRINSHTFNSIRSFDSSGKLGLLGDLVDAKPVLGTQINIKSIYPTFGLGDLRLNDTNGITQYSTGFFVRLQGKTTLAEYNEYLNSNPLTILYELATYEETSFTMASLVTENAEIPLSNEDGTLIGKCTEQLSENPGFIDAKIKLSDSDGDVYSNKLQLHVERSPQ